MGLFDFIFPKQKVKAETYRDFKMLSGYTPHFSSWRGALYESQLIRAAIDCKARNIAKLKIVIKGSAKPQLYTNLKHAPNEWQTWSQFMYRLATILEVQNTAFIVPVYSKYGDISGIYPILPTNSEIVESKDHVPYVRYTFLDGKKAAMELQSVGILTKFQYDHDFLGADNNKALKPTMDLIHLQNQGITEGVKSSATFRFMAQLDNFSTDEDLKKERTRFNETNLKSEEGGLLLFPHNYTDIKQIDSKPFVANAAQQKLIEDGVYDYFGVSKEALQNKLSGDEWSAFYEGAIEPFAIQFSEVVTRMLFTDKEQSFGACIMATSNRLQYMTNADKLSVSAQMTDRGIMSRNEVREIWNLPPIEGGDQYIIRGEYYLTDDKLQNQSEGVNDGQSNT